MKKIHWGLRVAHVTVLATIPFVSAPAVAQTKDHAPVGLSASRALTQDKQGSESWTYVNPNANFSSYRNVVVEPGQVYNGSDAQFDGIDQADRLKYAGMMADRLRSELAKSFPPPTGTEPGTVRIRLSLLGAKKTIGGAATATRLTPMGFGLSAAKSLLGRGGSLTGSALYAVEAFDNKTGEMLLTAVRRRTPDPLDIPATISTTATIEAVAREFAESARKRLESLTGVGSR